eukprot:CAMPEP_0119308812 /NCGR_PEP_ID=MMETSP1333-20130426/12782_1 /TAXON_ID=418940 /ORGANISM="Scyphosphaera apsteinii, Strain RCC1455" /LENGTH=159 /DNA_ID=CAMNT_0007312669 /DNA_START=110 /DNA_END=589 /DNA_ORIENTATION=-
MSNPAGGSELGGISDWVPPLCVASCPALVAATVGTCSLCITGIGATTVTAGLAAAAAIPVCYGCLTSATGMALQCLQCPAIMCAPISFGAAYETMELICSCPGSEFVASLCQSCGPFHGHINTAIKNHWKEMQPQFGSQCHFDTGKSAELMMSEAAKPD